MPSSEQGDITETRLEGESFQFFPTSQLRGGIAEWNLRSQQEFKAADRGRGMSNAVFFAKKAIGRIDIGNKKEIDAAA
jgi:hypothetical protein